MRRGKYLAKNTAIFALGNIGTNIVAQLSRQKSEIFIMN